MEPGVGETLFPNLVQVQNESLSSKKKSLSFLLWIKLYFFIIQGSVDFLYTVFPAEEKGFKKQ